MKTSNLISVIALCSGPLLAAQPAIYQDGVFTVFLGAVIEDGAGRYYEDIELRALSDGSFQVESVSAFTFQP